MLRLAASGVVEICPEQQCAFWEPGGAVVEGSCLIERLAVDLRDEGFAEYLLEAREGSSARETWPKPRTRTVLSRTGSAETSDGKEER